MVNEPVIASLLSLITSPRLLPPIIAGVCKVIASLFCTVESEPELPQPTTKQDRSAVVITLRSLRLYLGIVSFIVNSKLIKHKLTN